MHHRSPLIGATPRLRRSWSAALITLITFAMSIAGYVTPAHAADSISISSVTINAGDAAASLASSVSVNSPFTRPAGGSCASGNQVLRPYAGKYVEIAIPNGTSDDVLSIDTVSTPGAGSGVVSVVGTEVYVGDGSIAHRVGSIDSTRSGGNTLRVNFTNNDASAFIASRSSYSTGQVTTATFTPTIWSGWIEEAGRASTVASSWYESKLGSTTFPKLTGFTGTGGGVAASQYVNGTASAITNTTDTGTHTGAYPCSLDLNLNLAVTSGTGLFKGTAMVSPEFTATAGDRIYFTHRNYEDAPSSTTIRVFTGLFSGSADRLLDVASADMSSSEAWHQDYSFGVSAAGTYRLAISAGLYLPTTVSKAINSHVKFDLFSMDAPVSDAWATNIVKAIKYQNTAATPPASQTLIYSIGVQGGSAITRAQTVTITPAPPTPTPSTPAPTISPSPAVATIAEETPAPAPTATSMAISKPVPAAPPVAGVNTNQAAPATTSSDSLSEATVSSGIPSLLELVTLLKNDPGAALNRLVTAVFAPPSFSSGAPNAALGATGNDSAPVVAFDPMGSAQAISAVGGALAMAAALAGAVAAAAGGSESGSLDTDTASANSAGEDIGDESEGIAEEDAEADEETESEDEESESDELEFDDDEFETRRTAWGDRWAFLALPLMSFFDRRSYRAAMRIARFSPLLAKLIVDGAYLRAIVGSLAVLLPLAGVVIAVISVSHNGSEVLPPPVPLFLAMAGIGTLDALAGFLAGVVFIVGSVAASEGSLGIGDYRMLFAVLFVMMGPPLLMTVFRKIRKEVEVNTSGMWERLTDFVIAPLMAGVAVSTAVMVLPAVSGLTLPVANHVTEFGLLVGACASARVGLEELASRAFPRRLNRINADDLPDSGVLQQSLALVTTYLIWVFMAGAISGDVWQVWVGTVFFLLPLLLGKFSENFPNSVVLWRILPQGMPGLIVKILIGSATALIVMMWTGAKPEFAAWNMIVLPLPLLALSVLGMFGRHGAHPHEVRFSQRNPWVFRVGGVLILLIGLRLMAII